MPPTLHRNNPSDESSASLSDSSLIASIPSIDCPHAVKLSLSSSLIDRTSRVLAPTPIVNSTKMRQRQIDHSKPTILDAAIEVAVVADPTIAIATTVIAKAVKAVKKIIGPTAVNMIVNHARSFRKFRHDKLPTAFADCASIV